MAELIVKIDPADVAERALDEITYKGKTIREWADLLTNPKTKGDEIRVMSDEELAEWIVTHDIEYGDCPPQHPFCDVGIMQDDCRLCWLDWIKSEITE